MRFIGTIILAAIALGLAILVLNGILSYSDNDFLPGGMFPDAWTGPDSWSEWRDISIVFMAVFWTLGGILLVVLMVVLIILVNLLRKVMKENAVPAIDSLKSSLDNIKGTTEFAGETVASPIIRTYAVFKGVRTGLGAVTGVGDRIRGRKKKRGIL